MPNVAYRPPSPPYSPARAFPVLERVLRQAMWLGLALVVVFPGARGHGDWLGWMPLWLVGMPAAAWWAMHRFRLPGWPAQADALRRPLRRRRFRGQARRCARPTLRRSTQAA